MLLKTYNIRRYSVLLSVCLMLISEQVLALARDNQKPIHIDSEQQSVDMDTNTVTLTGDVVVKRGSIDIRADKIVITRAERQEVVEGYGTPVTFYQLQEDGKPVHGISLQMRYETANDMVILTGNAYLEQHDNNVKSDYITYLIKKQQIEAFSKKDKRVTTVLVPAQFQDKRVVS